MTAVQPQLYVTIDGYKYAVETGTYLRKWARLSNPLVVAGAAVILNFVDNGPGIQTYSMRLILQNWDTSSELYQAGVTQTIAQQVTNIEASYRKVATPLQFVDPFGNSPANPSNTSNADGVYFTLLNQAIPNYSTIQKPSVIYEIELLQATRAVPV